MKKIILFICGVVLFPGCHIADASIIINEVQLSPTSERFVELYNTDDSAVDLTEWYMQRKTATGTTFGSLVTNTNFLGKTIGAHDYFVISRSSLSTSDLVLGSLTLTESNTIQIKNPNGDVVDKIGWGSATDCITPCPPNPIDGQSIAKISSGWIAGTPTPGVANETSPTPPADDTTPDDVVAGEVSGGGGGGAYPGDIPSKTKPPEIKKIRTQIIANKLVFVGSPFSLREVAFGHNGEELSVGKYFLNFGDGDSLETQANTKQQFTHTYFYPGEYVLSLDYYMNYTDIPDATDKITIKVVGADIVISKVGDQEGQKDFFVELTNNTSYDTDISKWALTGENKNFIFPKNTILSAKKKVIFSSKVTHFSISDESSLKLINPQNELAFDYGATLVPISVAFVPAQKSTVTSQVSSDISVPYPTSSPQTPPEETVPEISAENLGALAIASDVLPEETGTSSVPIAIATLLIGGSAGAAYVIRRRKVVNGVGSDFELLDE